MNEALHNQLEALRADVASYREANESRLDFAMSAGRQLNMLKEQTDHGQWLPLLRDVGLAERTAQRWMALSAYYGDAEIRHVAHLGSITFALSPAGKVVYHDILEREAKQARDREMAEHNALRKKLTRENRRWKACGRDLDKLIVESPHLAATLEPVLSAFFGTRDGEPGSSLKRRKPK